MPYWSRLLTTTFDGLTSLDGLTVAHIDALVHVHTTNGFALTGLGWAAVILLVGAIAVAIIVKRRR